MAPRYKYEYANYVKRRPCVALAMSFPIIIIDPSCPVIAMVSRFTTTGNNRGVSPPFGAAA